MPVAKDYLKEFLTKRVMSFNSREGNNHLVEFDYDFGDEWPGLLFLPADVKAWLDSHVVDTEYDFYLSSYSEDSSRACVYIWFKSEAVAMIAKLAWGGK
jgi:hypothetical protein